MTEPKQKAKEIFWKHLTAIEGWKYPEKSLQAIKCSIITIDEIIDSQSDYEKQQTGLFLDYYNEVREELEKIKENVHNL